VDTSRGEEFARFRSQEARALKDVLRGSGNCRAFQSGRKFDFMEGSHPYFDQDWVLLTVEHTASEGGYRSGGKGAGYFNRFQCIPADTKFRPARTTPRPQILSSQTAIVTGPSGEEIYTDEEGRVKVSFHWDRYSSKDENSSCWLRVAQLWAGPGWGGLFLPRIGQEVIVNFLEGDPDRPIVTGCVYNGENPPKLKLPDEKTQSAITSESSLGGGGFNEIRFEDKAGEELLYFHAQKDREVEIQNDNRETVHHDESTTIDNEQTLEVGANRTVSVGGDHEERVEGNQALTISSDREMTVSGSLTDTIDGDRSASVGGDDSTSIIGKLTLDVTGDAKASVTGKTDVSVTGDTSLSGVGKVEISSVKEIKLSAGPASITIKSTGDVEITGLNVKVNGSLTTEVKAGTKLTLKGLTTGIN
jgi:type VI secretion system secreted protein VgrG